MTGKRKRMPVPYVGNRRRKKRKRKRGKREREREGKRVDEAKEKTFNCGALLRLQGLQSIYPGRYSIQRSLRGGCQVHLEIFTISRSVPEMARGFFGHLINQF